MRERQYATDARRHPSPTAIAPGLTVPPRPVVGWRRQDATDTRLLNAVAASLKSMRFKFFNLVRRLRILRRVGGVVVSRNRRLQSRVRLGRTGFLAKSQALKLQVQRKELQARGCQHRFFPIREHEGILHNLCSESLAYANRNWAQVLPGSAYCSSGKEVVCLACSLGRLPSRLVTIPVMNLTRLEVNSCIIAAISK